jgi:putative acetyltransferase
MHVTDASPADRTAIGALLEAAFPSDDEAALVAALRATPAYDPALELVAIEAGTVVGHVLFSTVTIPGTERPDRHLVLAPLAVRPSRQGEGVGSALVRAGLDRAGDRGFGSVVLHGAPGYYGRFGFERADGFGLENPFDLPDADFQAVELRDGALAGAAGPVHYPAPFERL